MYALALGDINGYVWVGSSTILPKLMQVRDAGNNNIWMMNAATGPVGSILGLPFLRNGRSPVLGSEGDLMLVDLKNYWIKDGAAMSIFVNPYLNSRTAQTDIQVNFSVDGQLWLSDTVLDEDGVTEKSPVIVLK